MSNVRRVYVEKKPAFAVKAKELKHEIKHYLGISTVTAVRELIRYDVENISDEVFEKACKTVFAEPPVDDLYLEKFEAAEGAKIFSVEYLPGQFDQRADSAVQCVQFLDGDSQPIIRSATTYVIEGNVTDAEFEAIKHHCINPVDSRETGLEKPETLVTVFPDPEDVKIFDGFKDMAEADLKELYSSLNLAMTFKDFQHIQNYFRNEEKRDPSMTEIRVLDTYWSDHCRHTTFSTELTSVKFDEGDYKTPIEKTYKEYLDAHKDMYKGRDDKFVCLMDLALMAMKKLKAEGKLADQEESDEINACSIVVPVDVDGKEEEWLINFKNETHNHPTEIEPFGGAATCLGGAIRDPLSGRTYVYQAMRVTGAADPTVSVKETLKGKLPQKKLVRSAAHGYSSYGNQIGLATGAVKEIYHPDYVAKRMEIGAVMGAAPRRAVIRENSDPGDIIILLGGRTGRDGIGGATGSSKAHNEESVVTCGSEVQKGNPPVERKIQRLFRDEKVTTLIKRCNDFGAGGVSVAIGELADGLVIDLDKVPKKYEGLDGTELAISESQERMAVVVRAEDSDKFIEYSNNENLEATKVAYVTDENRLVMNWRGKTICDISRDFLNTNGATKNTDIEVVLPDTENSFFKQEVVTDVKAKWLETLSDLNVCSQKGLCEKFDSTIGANSVLMPFGGKYQLTPSDGMAAKVPVLDGETNTATVMTFGYNPKLSSWSQYHGSTYAIVESVSKAVALGADYKKIYLTFQEYFERLGTDPKRWGKPFASLLGAYKTQLALGIAAIGGKDSMSGSFNDLDVPPTLTSFAVAPVKADKVISQEIKKAGSKLVMFTVKRDENDLPKFDELKKMYDTVHQLILDGKVLSASVVKGFGLVETVSKMSFGNMIGVEFNKNLTNDMLFYAPLGSIVLEVEEEIDGAVTVGTTGSDSFTVGGVNIPLSEAAEVWKKPLEKVFPTKAGHFTSEPETFSYDKRNITVATEKFAKPRVFIPVFPGTNCEYDTARAFENAGAVADVFVVRNLTGDDVVYSMKEMQKRINNSQIVMIPGGFSGGDEPEGSGKFIATAFRNPLVKDAVMNMLKNRDGLMLGICNGFQALIKLGLVPYGEIRDLDSNSPTLTFNTIGRHVSCMARTRIASNKSPWLANVNTGDVHTIALSHGEGRFIASEEQVKELAANGQIATQYVNLEDKATYDIDWNPNGSVYAIEGITSPDGRVLGKMGHSERIGKNVSFNVPGNKDQKLFEAGVKYFK
jgi:phosphoribosylformylglycinamidine synthase